MEIEPTFRPGNSTFMFELPPFYTGGYARARRQWDIAPDGERFLLLNPGDVPDLDSGATQLQIIVVLNWFEELRQRVPVN